MYHQCMSVMTLCTNYQIYLLRKISPEITNINKVDRATLWKIFCSDLQTQKIPPHIDKRCTESHILYKIPTANPHTANMQQFSSWYPQSCGAYCANEDCFMIHWANKIFNALVEKKEKRRDFLDCFFPPSFTSSIQSVLCVFCCSSCFFQGFYKRRIFYAH